MKKHLLTVFIIAGFSYWAGAQVLSKRTTSTTNIQTAVPVAGEPGTLVFTESQGNYQWGKLVSENDSAISISFLEGWGNCTINRSGIVTVTSGIPRLNQQFNRVGIFEDKILLTDPVNQVQQNLCSRLAFSVNNKPFIYAGWSENYNRADQSIIARPMNSQTQNCHLYFLQNKWTIGSSPVPGLNNGDRVSAVYAYGIKERSFLKKN